MADLRPTVVWLTTMACPWSSQEVSDICGLTLSRIRAYLSTLANQGVVVALKDDSWRAGPKAAAWRAKPAPKGPSYGNSAEYQHEKALKDTIRLRDWTARRNGLKEPTPSQKRISENLATLTSQELAGDSLDQLETPGMSNTAGRTLEEAAQLLGCSTFTIRREISRGHLKAYRLGARGIRIAADEIEAYQRRRELVPEQKEGKAS